MSFQEKYLKYKQKYLELKKVYEQKLKDEQTGGFNLSDETEDFDFREIDSDNNSVEELQKELDKINSIDNSEIEELVQDGGAKLSAEEEFSLEFDEESDSESESALAELFDNDDLLSDKALKELFDKIDDDEDLDFDDI
tara:strand:- start:994 stop:1410 length:417 start_codon:yes stop_codon:yes gene_type:complete